MAGSDLEQRVKDLEDLIADMPHLVTLRMETLVAVQRETSGRLDHLDRQITVLMRDVRDMRGGVTRMLVEQDKRLALQDERLQSHDQRLTSIEQRVSGIEQHVERLGSVSQDMNTKLDRILIRLG